MPDDPIVYVIVAAVIVGCLAALLGGAVAWAAFTDGPTEVVDEFPPGPPASSYKVFDHGEAWRTRFDGDECTVEVMRSEPRPRASIV